MDAKIYLRRRAAAQGLPVRSPSQRRSAVRRPAAQDDVSAIVQGLRRIVKALALYSQVVRRAYGLTGSQLWAIKTLQRLGPMTAGQMAYELAVHQSSVSTLVDRLEQRGLVRRVRSLPDRRFVRIQLTPQGERLAVRAPEAAQGHLLHGLKAMTPGEVRRLRQAITRLVGTMEADTIDAPFFFGDE
jgi:DNA-binding MarR family transcriptional regulator